MGQKLSALVKGRKPSDKETKALQTESSANDTESSNDYLAKPSGPCCLKGTLHKGEARGRWETITGVETYISEPPAGKANGHVLLYFPDVWGMFANGFLVMDGFADAGFLVLGLDYFRGVSTPANYHLDGLVPWPSLRELVSMSVANPLRSYQDPVWKHRKNRHDRTDPDFDYEAWKRKHTTFADEAVPKWVDEVKRRHGNEGRTKFACVGYCFGAPYVCDELAKDMVTVGAFAHPAFLKEHHFENLKSECFSTVTTVDSVGRVVLTDKTTRTSVSVMLGDRPHLRRAIKTESLGHHAGWE